MRRITITLILSLFLTMGSGVAFADSHNDRGRREQRDNRKDNGRGRNVGRDNRKDNDRGRNVGRDNRKDNGRGRDVGRDNRRDAGHYVPAPPPQPPHLGNMVRFATRGCHDVAVWQINPDTYIVKYRKGNRFYTRRLYPYADRYDSPVNISVNWSPMSPWTLIPSFHLNISL